MKKSFIIIFLVASINLFSQEYEIAWQKDMPQMSYAQFSKDGQFIYCAVGNEIWKYRSDNGEFISKFDTSGAQFNSDKIYFGILLSGNGNYLLVRTDGGNCIIFNTKTEKVFKNFNFGGSSDISADENTIITARYDGTFITKFDLNLNKFVMQKPTNEQFKKIKLSHNGKMFATSSRIIDSQQKKKFYLTLWDTETLTEIKRFQLEDQLGDTEFKDIKFSWDDKYVGVNRIYPYDAFIYDVEMKQKYTSSEIFDPRMLGSFGFTKDELLFYFGDPNKEQYSLKIFKTKTFSFIQSFDLPGTCWVSENNLIFTGKALLKPKTVGVTEPIQPKIFISNSKDFIIIENKSEINEQIETKIYDLQGKEIFNNSIFLNFGIIKILIPKTIMNGSYIIQLSSKSINISQKILIEE
jgi:WD40 repeat protein